jgi:hypothetical protein
MIPEKNSLKERLHARRPLLYDVKQKRKEELSQENKYGCLVLAAGMMVSASLVLTIKSLYFQKDLLPKEPDAYYITSSVQKDVDANGLYEWLYSDGIDYVVQKKDDSVSLLPVEKYLEDRCLEK